MTAIEGVECEPSLTFCLPPMAVGLRRVRLAGTQQSLKDTPGPTCLFDEIASIEAAHAGRTAGPSAAGVGRGGAAAEIGAGDKVAAGSQAVDGGIDRGAGRLDAGMPAELAPGGQALAHAVVDLQHAAVGITAIVVSGHSGSPKK